jgi:hypothetical protein
MILSIAEAGKLEAGTSSRQQPSQMEAFRGQAMLRAKFGEKLKERKEPIRSDQSATLFMHVPISSKLAHFLLKHFKQIHNLKGKNRE